jgi:hypothetical protein
MTNNRSKVEPKTVKMEYQPNINKIWSNLLQLQFPKEKEKEKFTFLRAVSTEFE